MQLYCFIAFREKKSHETTNMKNRKELFHLTMP